MKSSWGFGLGTATVVRGFGEVAGSYPWFGIQLAPMLFATAMLGFAFGFVGSIPIAGPIAVLVWSRGLQDRARSALYIASGAAIAEGAYAYLAFWGFSELLARYAWIETASRVAAAGTLTGLGVRFVRRPHAERTRARTDPRSGNKRSFLVGLTITALNPMLIAVWTAAIATLYSLGLLRSDLRAALPFSLGACAGITAWFATLIGLLQRVRQRVPPESLDRWMRGMGVMLILLGLGLGAHWVRH